MVAFIMTLVLTGCATPQVYNPTNVKKDELATLKTTAGKNIFLTKEYIAWILYIYDSNNEEVTKRNPLSNKINQISLPSGSYRVQAECVNKMYSGSPMALFTLESSKTYQVFCDITKGENFLGMNVDSKVQLKIKEIN